MGGKPKKAGDIGKALRGWLFLIAVGGIYALTSLFNPRAVSEALALFGPLLVQIMPVLVLVFGLLFLVGVFLEKKWLVQKLGKASGFGGWALTVVCGIFSVGPLYAWYPLLGELKAKGMSSALIATFLYARALKLPLLPLIAHYFGFSFTLALSGCIIMFSVLSGLLIKRIVGIDTL